MASELKASYSTPVPIHVTWKLAKKVSCSNLMAQIMPSYFANIDILEGGEGAGTVRVVTMGEGVGPKGAGQKVKEIVDVVDDSTHTISFAVVEGGDPRYSNVRFTLKFTPAGDATATEWTVHYTPADDSVPPPEHYKAMADETNKAMSVYAKEHAAELQ